MSDSWRHNRGDRTYHEALDKYVNVSYIRERFGRKVFRDGRWEKFHTPEKQMRALKEASLSEREGGETSSRKPRLPEIRTPSAASRSESVKP